MCSAMPFRKDLSQLPALFHKNLYPMVALRCEGQMVDACEAVSISMQKSNLHPTVDHFIV